MREARPLTKAGKPYAGRVLSSAFPAPRRSLRMTPDERRADLIATTISLLGTRSLADISPELIAREAGVSRALFYRYFSGLDEAFTEAFKTITGLLRTSLEGLPGGSLRRQLEIGIGAFLDFATTFREAYIAMFTLGAATAGGPLSTQVEEIRQTILKLMSERSGVAPTSVFEMTARAWLNATEAVVLHWLENEPLDRGEIQQWLIDQLIAMLTVSAGSDPVSAEVVRRFDDQPADE